MAKPPTKTQDLKVERVPFVTMAALKSLTEINNLSEADLLELCQQFPKAAAQLIIDLNTEWGLALTDLGKLRKELKDKAS